MGIHTTNICVRIGYSRTVRIINYLECSDFHQSKIVRLENKRMKIRVTCIVYLLVNQILNCDNHVG